MGWVRGRSYDDSKGGVGQEEGRGAEGQDRTCIGSLAGLLLPCSMDDVFHG